MSGGMGNVTDDCTEACFAMPECTVCGLRKPPRGRSVAIEAASGYCCSHDCPGYWIGEKAGHLWSEEREEWREMMKNKAGDLI